MCLPNGQGRAITRQRFFWGGVEVTFPDTSARQKNMAHKSPWHKSESAFQSVPLDAGRPSNSQLTKRGPTPFHSPTPTANRYSSTNGGLRQRPDHLSPQINNGSFPRKPDPIHRRSCSIPRGSGRHTGRYHHIRCTSTSRSVAPRGDRALIAAYSTAWRRDQGTDRD